MIILGVFTIGVFALLKAWLDFEDYKSSFTHIVKTIGAMIKKEIMYLCN